MTTPTRPRLNGPYLPGQRWLRALPGSPCSRQVIYRSATITNMTFLYICIPETRTNKPAPTFPSISGFMHSSHHTLTRSHTHPHTRIHTHTRTRKLAYTNAGTQRIILVLYPLSRAHTHFCLNLVVIVFICNFPFS